MRLRIRVEFRCLECRAVLWWSPHLFRSYFDPAIMHFVGLVKYLYYGSY